MITRSQTENYRSIKIANRLQQLIYQYRLLDEGVITLSDKDKELVIKYKILDKLMKDLENNRWFLKSNGVIANKISGELFRQNIIGWSKANQYHISLFGEQIH